jgi:hypothetical protein
MSRKILVLAIIASAMASGANAAHLSDIEGAVFVNNKPIDASIEVTQGDRIKTLKGSATLVYSNGASVRIKPGHMLVVLENPPEQMSMKDGVLPPADSSAEAALVVAGGVALTLGLTELGRPVSP